MTVDEYLRSIRRRLHELNIDFSSPDPALAWAVFKEHATVPVECHDSYLFWEAASDYFDFVREFRHYTENDAVWHEQLTFHFTCSPTDRTSINTFSIFSDNYPNYEMFFKAVEGHPEFIRGLTFDRWSLDLRLDSC